MGRFLINFLISKTNQIKIENARTQTEKSKKQKRNTYNIKEIKKIIHTKWPKIQKNIIF